MSKPLCMVMNYKLCICSHLGIIFWQWGCSWHTFLLSRFFYHLNKNFETANMVNIQCRHSRARAHESLFCQSRAGALTGQLPTAKIQWCAVCHVCACPSNILFHQHSLFSVPPIIQRCFKEKSSYKGTSITFTPALNTSRAGVALCVVDFVSFFPALKYLEPRFVVKISGTFLWPHSSYLVF